MHGALESQDQRPFFMRCHCPQECANAHSSAQAQVLEAPKVARIRTILDFTGIIPALDLIAVVVAHLAFVTGGWSMLRTRTIVGFLAAFVFALPAARAVITD